uniref:Cytochrome P450 n=1 Tax=Phaedon brassicae TaxID=154011 RepID=A0A9Y1PPR2_9CUCU|nr:cytochrome P450 [Phaedon brassicae]
MSILLVILITICYYFLERSWRTSKHWQFIKDIPCPKAYPIIGTLKLDDSEGLFKRNRSRAKQFYPIYKLWSFNVYFVCPLSPEDIELVLNNVKHNTKSDVYHFLHGWLGTGLLTSSGSKWHKRRKILTPAFHFSILQQFIDIFNQETENLVRVLEDKCHESYIDVVKPITDFTLYLIGETSLGVKLNEGLSSGTYKKAVYEYGHNITYRIVRPWFYTDFVYSFTTTSKSDRAAIEVLHDFSTKVIKERKKLGIPSENVSSGSYSGKKRLAMLDLMLRAENEGADIDDEGIREEVDTFMFEGHDTTSMAICYALMALANETEIQDEIRREIQEIVGDSLARPTFSNLGELRFTERCIKECLRLYPSVPFISRFSGAEIRTHTGYTIPRGANINVHIFDLHRSPHVWNNPEKFDPDRFLPENVSKRHPFAYLPFSAGPRNCIGQRFAILEIKAALCGILRKFKLEAVDKPEDMVFKSDLVLRPAGEIRVKFVPREIK